MKKLIFIFSVAVVVGCKKEAPEPVNPPPVVYKNSATIVYTSQWNDSTTFFWSNWSDPHKHSGVSTSTCELNHVLRFGYMASDINGAANGTPGGSAYVKTWKSTGGYIMKDTIKIEWESGSRNTIRVYFSDVVKYSACSGFQSGMNPWMTANLDLKPDTTIYHTNYTYNYTYFQ